MQNINVKIFATPESSIDWADLIPVFHRWIRDNEVPGTPIDVADYAHVPEGPGVLLIADEAFYSVDNRTGRLGFLYNRRRPVDDDLAANIRDAYDAALTGARKLEGEVKGLQFDPAHFEIFVNDRALAPNNEDTDQTVRPAVEAFCTERFGKPAQVTSASPDPRSLYRLEVRPAA
jgi:hypothetical protein